MGVGGRGVAGFLAAVAALWEDEGAGLGAELRPGGGVGEVGGGADDLIRRPWVRERGEGEGWGREVREGREGEK